MKTIWNFLLVLVTLLNLALSDETQETVIVTRTKYVSAPCLEYQAGELLAGNPEGLTTGMRVVFVYGDEISPVVNEANAGDTQNIVLTPLMLAGTAETTTEIIFSAATALSTSWEPTSTNVELSTTEEARVTNQAVLIQDISVTINVSSITEPVTLENRGATNQLAVIVPTVTEASIVFDDISVVNVDESSSYEFEISSQLESSLEELDYPTGTEIEASLLSYQSSEDAELSTYNTETVETEQVTSEDEQSLLEEQFCYSGDLFRAISTEGPPSIFSQQVHPLPLPDGVDNGGLPIGTNKFYSNLFLGIQNQMVWTFPYMFWLVDERSGVGIQHTDASKRGFGVHDERTDETADYFFNPVKIEEWVLSATTFERDSVGMEVTNMRSLSALMTLRETENGDNYLEVPLVQGAGFATGIFHGNLILLLTSQYGINSLTEEISTDLLSLKYRAALADGSTWLIYVTLPTDDPNFNLEHELLGGSSRIIATKSVDGLVLQLALAPEQQEDEVFYDQAAGMYVTSANVQGEINCDLAQYLISFVTRGLSLSETPIIFALPHHLQSLTTEITDRATGIQMQSTTKGQMQGFLSNRLTFVETLERSVQFLPWIPGMNTLEYTTEQLQIIASVANVEIAADIQGMVTDTKSNYFTGKLLDKYANILLVIFDILRDESVAIELLDLLKDAFEIYLKNEQPLPFVYDITYKGISACLNGGEMSDMDYGACYYNDHHFHYGYLIHAAAIIGYVDKSLGGTWAQDNSAWVNALVRDIANPSEDDTYFPVFRLFDWFQGHSWAKGLFESADGKDEESSSEDIHFVYGMKLWGNVIGDFSMEARGGLMLAVMKRALNLYFYFSLDNTIQPPEMLSNKVSGILFENKIDYSTYFGRNTEYIHGIHMLPITLATALIRLASFAQEEWEAKISTIIDELNDGWAGILRLNQALFDPLSAYNFFSSESFTDAFLDNGQSRTWSLAFAAAALNAR